MSITPRQPQAPTISFRQLLTSAITGRQSTSPPSLSVKYNEPILYQNPLLYNAVPNIPGVAIPRATTPANITARVLASSSMKAR
jgi:hypothetical protein